MSERKRWGSDLPQGNAYHFPIDVNEDVGETEWKLLGGAIRSLRKDRGMSGRDLGNRIHTTQSAISKYENGKSKIDPRTFRSICEALNLDESETDLLHRYYELTSISPTLYRAKRTRGLDVVQRRIREYEEGIKVFREYQNAFVPGLLQTPDYMACIFNHLGVPANSIKNMSNERCKRKNILVDSERSFVFLLLEQILHSNFVFREVMISQINVLKMLEISFSNIAIGIIPLEIGCLPCAPTNFIIYDRVLVTSETTVSEQRFESEADINEHISIFEKLHDIALFGEACITRLERIASELSTNPMNSI